MKLTKLGHCCLIIEENGLRIMTDPGHYSTAQNEAKNIDLVLFTHEHQDHLHLESLRKVLENNPQAKIITNQGVGKILQAEGIPFETLLHSQKASVKSVLIEGFGDKHAEIYETMLIVQNTGYFIANRFFYPGDALTNPGKAVEILALPVAGPWLSIKNSLNYAKEIKPKTCFPVHDGMLKFFGAAHALPEKIVPSFGSSFFIPKENEVVELN